MRLPSSILYLSVDLFLPLRGKPATGFDEFTAELEHAGIPVVWVSSRNRFQLDAPRRAIGHSHPVIGEGGCGVYIPEGYFNVRAEKAVRLGRFTCIPIAQQQPAAADALEHLSAETGIETVPVSSLSPRELAQNTGLPSREAELMRHRDFDEVFFFAGVGDTEVARFSAKAKEERVGLRRSDGFWSVACGASITLCVRDTNQLYQRALRTRVGTVAIAPVGDELLATCDRRIAIRETRGSAADAGQGSASGTPAYYLKDRDLWNRIAEFALRKAQ